MKRGRKGDLASQAVELRLHRFAPTETRWKILPGKGLIRPVHTIIRQEGFLFHPGKITTALFGRHCLTDPEKVIEHHSLTFRTQSRRFRQSCINLRCHFCCIRQQLPQLPILCVNVSAHFPTLWQIGSVEFGHTIEFGVAQFEFFFQPSQFRFVAALKSASGRCAAKINARISCGRRDQTEHKNKDAAFHCRGAK